MKHASDTQYPVVEVKSLDGGTTWTKYWNPYVPFTTPNGSFYFGMTLPGPTDTNSFKKKTKNNCFTQKFTQSNNTVTGLGAVVQYSTWDNPYPYQILLGGTDEPLWAGCRTDGYAFVEKFENNGNMGETLWQDYLKDDAGNIIICEDLLPIINNVPNNLVKNISAISYSNNKIYTFEYNSNSYKLDYKSSSDTKPGYSISCAYEISKNGIIILQNSVFSGSGYPVGIFTSEDTSGPYTYQKDISFPRLYCLMKPLISQSGDMFLFCVEADRVVYDIYYLDPEQAGLPVGPVASGNLTDKFTAGMIGYDSSNNPFTLMQAEGTLNWGMYSFQTSAPPPPSKRPVPPSIDGIMSNQTWGAAQTNTFVTVTVAQPDGTSKTYSPTPTDGLGNWSLVLDPVAQENAFVSATASYGSDGTPSDAFVKEFCQNSYVPGVSLINVGETSVSGIAAADQHILGWRSSDGTKMVDYTLSSNETHFNTNYCGGLELADTDQLNVVAADPETGSMSVFNRKPEGYSST